MGREISQVMGHLGAGWLERPKREKEERTDLLIKNMGLKKGDKILFSKYGGTDVKVDGEDYLIMREDDILGVLA